MRPRFTSGNLLSARDLNDEQEARHRGIRRHDRFLHGAGVVCGLQVYADPLRHHPWTVGICPGYAVTPCGDEVEVPVRVVIDIRDFLWSRPDVNGVPSRIAFVGVRASDDEVPPSASGAGCGCGCSSTGASSSEHIHDGYAVEIVWTFKRTNVTFDLCSQAVSPCPPPPSGKHVVIAAVRLPAFESTPLTDQDIIAL